jgi:hypothetical protein
MITFNFKIIVYTQTDSNLLLFFWSGYAGHPGSNYHFCRYAPDIRLGVRGYISFGDHNVADRKRAVQNDLGRNKAEKTGTAPYKGLFPRLQQQTLTFLLFAS